MFAQFGRLLALRSTFIKMLGIETNDEIYEEGEIFVFLCCQT